MEQINTSQQDPNNGDERPARHITEEDLLLPAYVHNMNGDPLIVKKNLSDVIFCVPAMKVFMPFVTYVF
jgi:transcriptional regulator of met regulon